ncbi:hypothetical protein [Pantoea sp.]
MARKLDKQGKYNGVLGSIAGDDKDFVAPPKGDSVP